MTTETRTPPPWEPPVAGTEVEHLSAALDRQRTTFRWKADDLDAAGLQTRIGASSITLGGLLKHLAFVEAYYFALKLAGESPGAPWDAVDWDGQPRLGVDLRRRRHPGGALRTLGRRRRALPGEAGAALADGGLDQPVDLAWPDGRQASLRRVLCDLIEEYGRHTGHADLLREAVDGRVGEDPPADWRP